MRKGVEREECSVEGRGEDRGEKGGEATMQRGQGGRERYERARKSVRTSRRIRLLQHAIECTMIRDYCKRVRYHCRSQICLNKARTLLSLDLRNVLELRQGHPLEPGLSHSAHRLFLCEIQF